MPMAASIAPVVEIWQPVAYKNHNSTSARIIASTDQFILTGAFGMAMGRFMTFAEADAGRPVCVLGTNVAARLFGIESPLGKKIKVGARQLEVIGVIEKQGSFLKLPTLDDKVVIPIPQLLTGYWRNPDFQIQVKVEKLEQLDDAKEELRGLMRRIRHVAPGDPDDFAINQQEQIITIFNKVAGTIAAVGLIITGLSLFVGGIGIMNIMLVTVKERTREIGIRKAIGAAHREIMYQFLFEAFLISGGGAVIGILIGLAIPAAVQPLIPGNLRVPVSSWSVLAAFIVSCSTGLLFGYLPANQAARLQPIESLRYE